MHVAHHPVRHVLREDGQEQGHQVEEEGAVVHLAGVAQYAEHAAGGELLLARQRVVLEVGGRGPEERRVLQPLGVLGAHVAQHHVVLPPRVVRLHARMTGR